MRYWLRRVFGRRRLEAELDAELGYHLDRLAADVKRPGGCELPAGAERILHETGAT